MRWLWTASAGFVAGVIATAMMFSWFHPSDGHYWWWFCVELMVPLGLLSGLVTHFFLAHRFSRRVFQVAGALSGRICIVNRDEKIIKLIMEREADELHPVMLSDIPILDYSKISAKVQQVFSTKENTTLEYMCCGEHRFMSLAYLNKKVFGEEAVVWFSSDSSELENLRKESHSYVLQLQKQARMWKILMDTLPIHIFAKDVSNDFKYIFSNRCHTEYFNLNGDEMQGKTDFDLFPMDLAIRIRREDEYNMKNLGKSEETVVALADNYGKIHQLQSIKTPFIDADGTRLLLGAVMDVTELESIRKRIEDSATRLLQILNSIDDAVISTDTQGKVMLLNPVAERMLEIKEKNVLNKNIESELKFINSKTGLPIDPPISETIRRKISLYSGDNTVLISKSGNQYHIEGNSIPMFDGKDKFSGVLIVFRDVSARHKAAQKVVEALRKAKTAAQAKNLFVASVSHEIRTPLNAVIGLTELLRSGNVTAEEQANYLESIAFSSNALLQLINDVLDLSKLEADQIKIVTEEVDFKELVSEIIHVFKYRAKENHVDIKINIPALPKLELDKLRIRQILFNLVGNAIKFTPDGTIIIWAEYQWNQTFKFGVTDTGIGISDDDQKTLMEPFMQASRIRGTAVGNSGTGLGLAICKRLAERMNGALKLQSKLGQGSTFSVSLFQTNCVTQVDHSQLNETKPINTRLPIADNQHCSILIVDDVDMNLTVMRAMLKKLGFTNVMGANSAEKALKMVASTKFDLILTDMWMPVMSGADLARELRQIPSTKDLPIFVVTADIEVSENFKMDDFSGILLKPVTMDKLHNLFTIISSPSFASGGHNSLCSK